MKHENLKHLLGLSSFIILTVCIVQIFVHNLRIVEYQMFYAITFFSGILVVIEGVDLYKLINRKRRNNISKTVRG